MAREDDSEEIIKNIKGNLKGDTKDDVSEEGKIPPKEEENLNKSSDEDEEMYLWDELKYKANYIHFISNQEHMERCNAFPRSRCNTSDIV